MRVHGDDFEIAARDQLGQRELEIVVTQPEPVHTGINFEVAPESDVAFLGCVLQRAACAGRRDGWREVMVEYPVDVAYTECAENQNLGSDTRLPEDDRFFDVGARE